jgi:Mg/Co/Ni transporter MgtE
MSKRAAWRLERLGFRDVHVYAAGKADWAAAGLPLEGEDLARSIGELARRDVPICGPGERVGDVRQRVRAAGWDTCFVVVADRVVIGRLHQKDLEGEANARAEEVMHEGPSTFRPDVSLRQMHDYMHEHDLETAPVTTNDGQLIGLVRLEDIGAAMAEAVEAEDVGAEVQDTELGRRASS